MAFDASRPDRALLARVPFGDAWLTLDDPAERGAADPLDVGARLALYRLLIERTNPRGAFGAGDARSPLWGYAAQLAWQHRSGRLGGAGTEAARQDARLGAIEPASWWGACNYALSVVPYAGAARAGAVPRLDVGEVPAAYAPAVARWAEVAAQMVALARGDDLEPVRLAIWRAHLASIDAAVRLHRAAHDALPADERRFARGWVRMVDLFGAAGWRTDLERIAGPGGGALPSRMLGERDRLDDLDAAERRTVRSVHALGDRPPWQWRLELGAWRRMMRARAARDEAEGLLAGLLGRGRRTWPARARAVRYLI